MVKKKVNESLSEYAGTADKDHEVQMARADLYNLAHQSIELHKILSTISEEQGLEGWQQAKITKAADYINSVFKSLQYDQTMGPAPVPPPPAIVSAGVRSTMSETQVADYKSLLEKAKSKAQQKFMGMVHASQKGEKPASKEVAKVAKDMPKKAAKDYAATKHKGLPAHVKENMEVNEALPLLPLVIAAARAMAPALIRQGAKILSGSGRAAVAAPGAVAKIGTGVGRAGTGIGIGATGLAVKDVVDMAQDGIDAIGPIIKSTLGSEAFDKVLKFSSKHGLPILAVVAILYGGKKVIDFLQSKGESMQEAATKHNGLPAHVKEADDDDDTAVHSGNYRQASNPGQAASWRQDAIDRSEAALRKHPNFFTNDHLDRVDTIYDNIERTLSPSKIFVTHRFGGASGPYTSLAIYNPTWPRTWKATRAVRDREFYEPMKELGAIYKKPLKSGAPGFLMHVIK